MTKSKFIYTNYFFLLISSYQLNTEAGFLVSRRGVLSITNVGDGYLQGLIAVTTDKRWGTAAKPGLESQLRTIADSFKVYRLKSGIFASDA